MARTTVVVRARQCAGRSTVVYLNDWVAHAKRSSGDGSMAVSKTLLSPRGHSRQPEGKRRARAHPEPMDTEGVSFGARLARAATAAPDCCFGGQSTGLVWGRKRPRCGAPCR